MERFRKKKTRSNKSREESDETEPFSRTSTDLKMEVLMKLAPKSISKFIFVSKLWSSIIRDKEFTDLYVNQSSTRPRLLFRVHRDGLHFFHSSSEENPSYDEHERVSVSLDPNLYYAFSPPVRGLICGRNDSKVLVGNPSTGQFVTLPRLRTRRKGILSLLGYEPVDDVYKVLCMTVKGVYQQRGGTRVVSEEHQVFTIGSEEKTWRMVTCKHPHHPPYQTTGVCIDGVVYYYGWITSEKSLISFDLRSEEFNVVKLPEDVRLVNEFSNLVNYNGKIALTGRYFYGTLDMRVLEDADKQEWSKVSVVVHSWRDLARRYAFCLKGALSTGELIFATESSINPFYLISYDIKENNAKIVVIEGIGDNLVYIDMFLDHVDNPMYLSNVG